MRKDVCQYGCIAIACVSAVLVHSVSFVRPSVSMFHAGPMTDRSMAPMPMHKAAHFARTPMQCNPEGGDKTVDITKIDGGPVPLIILAIIVGVGGYAASVTQNPLAPHIRDQKGVVHALRVHHSKEEHIAKSSLSRFLKEDQKREILTLEEGGLMRGLQGKMSVKKYEAARTGVTTLSAAALGGVGLYLQWESIKSSLRRDETSFLMSAGLRTLQLGSVYESRDEKGCWWPVKVEKDNGNGSYQCRFVCKNVKFEDPTWPTVWVQNCRLVTQQTNVEDDCITVIAKSAA